MFLQTEGVNGEREVWDAGDRRSAPGDESWQLTENPDQTEGSGEGRGVPRTGRDLIKGISKGVTLWRAG